MMKTLLFLASSLLASTAALALDVGQELPAFELDDQHGETHTLDDSVSRIYTSSGRASDKMLKAALKEPKQAALDAQNAIVVADISAAPGFVRRIIRSSLKDRDYLTWVDQRGKTQKFLGYRDDRVGVIQIVDRKVTDIRYLKDEAELSAALQESLLPDTSAADTPAEDASADEASAEAPSPVVD